MIHDDDNNNNNKYSRVDIDQVNSLSENVAQLKRTYIECESL